MHNNRLHVDIIKTCSDISYILGLFLWFYVSTNTHHLTTITQSPTKICINNAEISPQRFGSFQEKAYFCNINYVIH